MSRHEEQAAKLVLQAALQESGDFQTEQEVAMLDPQRADISFQPGPGPRPTGRPFHLLTRMTAGPSLLELYSRTPTKGKVRGCLRKQLQHHHNLCLEAEKAAQPAPEIQQMWLICGGRPEGAMEAFWFVPLPRTPETILLRLLGRAKMRQEAAAEAHQLPRTDEGRDELISTMSRARFMIERDPDVPPEEKEEFMNAVNAEFEQFKQGLINKGIDKGIERGIERERARSVLRVLELRGVPISEEARARIASCTDLQQLDEWLALVLTAGSADDLFDR